MIQSRLTQARRNLKIDQSELARRTNIAKSTISRLENGERSPSGRMLVTLANILGVTTDWLLGRDTPDRGEEWQVLLASWPKIKPTVRTIIAQIARNNCHE
jgi:transcriptional regulator with XRE-family HTH domain